MIDLDMSPLYFLPILRSTTCVYKTGFDVGNGYLFRIIFKDPEISRPFSKGTKNPIRFVIVQRVEGKSPAKAFPLQKIDREDVMKKTKWLMAGGLLACLAAYPLLAQADSKTDSPATGPDNGTMQGPPPDGADMSDGGDEPQGEMGGKWVDRMKEKLDLTDAQVSRIKQVFENQKSTAKPIREDLKTQTKALAQKMKAGAGDGDLKSILDKIDQDRKNLDAARQQNMEALRGILTPTQQAKAYLAMAKRGMARMGHWKKGGRGADSPQGTPAVQ
jgi:Spy/CpxP family protein refolding chaperone